MKFTIFFTVQWIDSAECSQFPDLMLSRHFVELIDETAASIGENESSGFEGEVARASLSSQRNCETGASARISADVDTFEEIIISGSLLKINAAKSAAIKSSGWTTSSGHACASLQHLRFTQARITDHEHVNIVAQSRVFRASTKETKEQTYFDDFMTIYIGTHGTNE